MTLTSELVKVQYNGDDSTVNFAVPFIYYDDVDLKVILTDASNVDDTLIQGTHYTLVGGDGAAGTLTMITPPATGEKLTVKSAIPDTQETVLPLGGSFASTAVELRLDILTRLIQQKQEDLTRTIKLAESSSVAEVTIADPQTGEYLRWKADGTIESATLTLTGTAASVDETDTDTVKDKLVSNALAKGWEDAKDILAPGVLSKTSSYTVVEADERKLFLLSGNGFTLTLPSAATVGAGFMVEFKNLGNTLGSANPSQIYTLDPVGAETINSRTSHDINTRDDVVRITSDGSNWEITYRLSRREVIPVTFEEADIPTSLVTDQQVPWMGIGGTGGSNNFLYDAQRPGSIVGFRVQTAGPTQTAGVATFTVWNGSSATALVVAISPGTDRGYITIPEGQEVISSGAGSSVKLTTTGPVSPSGIDARGWIEVIY